MLQDTVLVDVYLSRHTLHRTDPRRGGGGGLGVNLLVVLLYTELWDGESVSEYSMPF